ncbi:MAG: isoprenylcysteine carboxylmethyltransferase family protein [Candidatus Neomarinimicrobiota bacterium]
MSRPVPIKNHPGRPDLTGEHPWGDVGQAVLAILFLIVWIADSFFLKLTTELSPWLPLVIRLPVGLVLLGLAWYLARTTMHIVFGQHQTEPQVIRQGIYNHIRHPMYLSEILLYLGLLVIKYSRAATLVWLVVIVFLYYISRYEEKLLLNRFGVDYENYRRDVPLLIPRWHHRR